MSADCESARAAASWANIDAARIGPELEVAECGTGGALSFSFGCSELARIRTASPSATKATTTP
jgi:hypothetical protein